VATLLFAPDRQDMRIGRQIGKFIYGVRDLLSDCGKQQHGLVYPEEEKDPI